MNRKFRLAVFLLKHDMRSQDLGFVSSCYRRKLSLLSLLKKKRKEDFQLIFFCMTLLEYLKAVKIDSRSAVNSFRKPCGKHVPYFSPGRNILRKNYWLTQPTELSLANKMLANARQILIALINSRHKYSLPVNRARGKTNVPSSRVSKQWKERWVVPKFLRSCL